MVYLLGIDFGTSGGRAIVLSPPSQDRGISEVAGQSRTEAPQGLTGAALAQAWWDQLKTLLEQLPIALRQRLGAIAINGTSSTVLLATPAGEVAAGPLMYNDDRGRSALKTFATLLPETSGARSATSTLAKVWWWRGDRFGNRWPEPPYAPLIFHQADWLSFQLHGQLHRPSPSAHPRAISDYHNALKLGYDPIALAYPHPVRLSVRSFVRSFVLSFFRLLPAFLEIGALVFSDFCHKDAKWQCPKCDGA